MPDAAVRLPNNLSEAPEVEFCGMVPRELYDRFRAAVPYYGANKWFLQFAMEAFLDEIDRSPALQDQVARSIKMALRRGPKE